MYSCHSIIDDNSDETFYIFASEEKCGTIRDMFNIIKPAILERNEGLLPQHLSFLNDESQTEMNTIDQFDKQSVILSPDIIQKIRDINGSYSIAMLLNYVQNNNKFSDAISLAKNTLKNKIGVLQMSLMSALLSLNEEDTLEIPNDKETVINKEMEVIIEGLLDYKNMNDDNIPFNPDLEKRICNLLTNVPPKYLLKDFPFIK